MKILSVTPVHKPSYFDGLQPLNINGLGRVVILVGPNGSGKTRVIRRIIQLNGQSREQAEILGFHIDGLQYGANVSVAYYSFHANALTDPAQLNNKQLEATVTQAQSLGLQNVGNGAAAYIQAFQDRWFEVTHPYFSGDSTTRDRVTKSYLELCSQLELLLNEKLSRNTDGLATLFGRPIADAVLSDGQRSLLTWAIALHAQGVKLGNVLLVMDEPENHLHPDAALQVICRAIETNPSGQVWIGTHSLPLLAGLESKYREEVSIFFMNAGSAKYAGREPEKIVLSLMGGEENVQAVRDFLDLPEVLAANNFAAECLRQPPVVAGASPDDPQVKAVKDCLPQVAGRLSKVLDFGAGDGRLVESLAAIHGPLDEALDYVAWDIPESKGDRCESALKRAYRNLDLGHRRFTNRDALFGKHPPGTFDAVVMCNVLHEIDPSEWPAVFDKNGMVAQALGPDGTFVVVEDYLMPKGEHAHRYGFIVLNTESLIALFGAGPRDEIEVRESEGRYKGRIRAHVVPKRLLSNVTKDTRRKALELAQRRASEEIHGLRGQNKHDFRSGQAHAFWVQQYANTSLALNDL
ncbi:AAA family ATPase [Fimbriiglobus ruber]|uniref:Uncharacterized protein n=1 Tax=Fimbriiglobus ruber TaxID=1908690 RepID=A0A225E588_9BACT|nr:AAA family ATPase [Fimbriiglobus ruber]OWK45266.1 hypothetical protein FRUB_01597 [Fimbriiglobus ruber]